jgi:hypothetical protein
LNRNMDSAVEDYQRRTAARGCNPAPPCVARKLSALYIKRVNHCDCTRVTPHRFALTARQRLAAFPGGKVVHCWN